MEQREVVHVTLVRHGESVANRQGRWQGQGDSPLSELGRAQAARAGERIAKRSFDRVIASDLQRASDTAAATRFRFERDAQFRELDVGRWEGLTRDEVNASFPEEVERLQRGEDVPLGGGESYAQFVARTEAALSHVCAQANPGERVMVVCHGGVIGALVSVALGIRKRGHWPIARVGNTSLTELHWSPEGTQLAVFNDDLHLEGMPASETDLPVAEHELTVVGEGASLAAHAERLGAAPSYVLADARVVDAPDVLRPFESAASSGADALDAWLGYASQSYEGRAARCVVHGRHVAAWLGEKLSLEVGATGTVSQPREQTYARLRGGDRPVLQVYNADPSR